MNIGIIGAGAIAQYVIEKLANTDFHVTALLVRDTEKYAHFETNERLLYTDVQSFLQAVDFVIEAATVEAVPQYLPAVLAQKPALIISVGALVDDELLQIVKQGAHPCYLPTGAIGSVDLLQNACVAEVEKVQLRTIKPAASLTAELVKEPTIIFTGTAREAIARYPKNMNVSIVLALAGIGFDRTMVQLVADPFATENIHEITINGQFGESVTTVKNKPLPQNPKTSYLAALSVVGTLQRLNTAIQIR